MTEKVKITQEQAKAIEWLVTFMKREHSDVITLHAKNDDKWVNGALNLNGMSLLTLVDALRIGYEIEPKYKVGDWVVSENPHFDQSKLIIGKIYTNELGDYDVDRGEKTDLSFLSDAWRHATLEEIKTEKERRLWKSIGRKVGEFKDNDVAIGTHGNTYRSNPGMVSALYKLGRLKGFYPAESFIMVGGDKP